MWAGQSFTFTCKVGLFLSRTCSDAEEYELEINPHVPPTLPGETKGTQGLIKNITSYILGIDLLKLDWSEFTVLWVNMCEGKCELSLGRAVFIFPVSESQILC